MAKTMGGPKTRQRPAPVPQQKSAVTMSRLNQRSNAGGAVRGQARAAQVKTLPKGKPMTSNPISTGGRASAAVAASARVNRNKNLAATNRRLQLLGGTPASRAAAAGASKRSTPNPVGIGFNAMVRRGAGNAILNALGRKR